MLLWGLGYHALDCMGGELGRSPHAVGLAARLSHRAQPKSPLTPVVVPCVPGGSASSSSSIMGATERLRSLLETLPPARAADVLASALADPGGRLAVLSAVEPKQRIELSIALANGALASLQRAGRVSVRSSAGRAGGVLAGRKPAAGADEGVVPEDDIKALRARLEGAGLPAEVLEVSRQWRGLAHSLTCGFAFPSVSFSACCYGTRSNVSLLLVLLLSLLLFTFLEGRGGGCYCLDLWADLGVLLALSGLVL